MTNFNEFEESKFWEENKKQWMDCRDELDLSEKKEISEQEAYYLLHKFYIEQRNK